MVNRKISIQAIYKKAFRDILEQRSMVVVISMMIMVGAGLFTTMISTLDSLKHTKEAYYREYDFAHVFASLKQAPERVLREIEDLPGVAGAQYRIVMGGNVEVESFDGAIRGLVISLPDGVRMGSFSGRKRQGFTSYRHDWPGSRRMDSGDGRNRRGGSCSCRSG